MSRHFAAAALLAVVAILSGCASPAGRMLTNASTRAIVMRKSIKSSHTATMGDSLAGVTRLRLAVEGAARANIAQGLEAIGELNL